METQAVITIPKSEPETVSDDVATCTNQSTVGIDDDPFVIADIPSSDGGWIEDLDEEVPALRKLFDGEDEIVDDVDEESEFNYDESFLSTDIDCAEIILGDLHNANEMANGAESAGHPEVSSSPQQNAPTSDSKVATTEAFTENHFQEQSKRSKNCDGEKSDDTFIVDNAITRETTLQTPQLSEEQENPSYVLKVKKIIDTFLQCAQDGTMTKVPVETSVSTKTRERLPLANTKESELGASLLPSKGVRETQSRTQGNVVSHAFDVEGRNVRMRRRKQVLEPRASDIGSDTEGKKKPDIETSPTKPDPISPMTRSRTGTSSQSVPSLLSNPPPNSSSSKFTVKARTKQLEVNVKGRNAREGLTWNTVSALSNDSSAPRSETKVGSKVSEDKSLDSEEIPVGPYTVRLSGKDQKNVALKFIASESPGDAPSQKQQSSSKAEDTGTSSKSPSNDLGTKKHYTSVDEYVQDLRRMMKVRGIKNMVLKGPKNVITDVTKKLNDSDSKKVLFRLGDAKTHDQKGTDTPRSLVGLKTSPPSNCLTPPSVDSNNKPSLKVDQSNAANFDGEGVLAKVSQVSVPKEQPSKSTIPRTVSPPTQVNCVKDSTPVNVGENVNEPKTLPTCTSQSTDVFKALSLLNLIRPPEGAALPSPAPISHAPAANHERIITTRVEATYPAARNTVIDSLGPVIPSSLSNGPPPTDQTGSTGLQRTTSTTGENTKTVTAGCAKLLTTNVDENPVKGKSTRITRSMSRPHQSCMVVKSQAGPMPPPSKIGSKTFSIIRIKDSSTSKQGNILGYGAPSQTSPTVPFQIRVPGKTDGRPCVPVVVVSRPNAAPPMLQPRRNDLVQYVVRCPDGQRKILQVPGGIPVHVSNALSGKPPIIECKLSPSVSVGKDNPIAGKQTADKELVKVTTEILPSGVQLKRVTTRARSPQEHVDGTAIRPERSKTLPKIREEPRINEFRKKDKNLVSNSDGSHVFTQTSAKTITQPILPENNPTEIPRASDKSVAKQVSQGSSLNDEKKGTCDSKGNLVNSSLTIRRSRRERKVARPYSPPPMKRRKLTSSPSSSSVADSSGERTYTQQLPVSQTSAPTAVDLKKATQVPYSSRLSDHTKSGHMKEKGSKRDVIIPPKGLSVFIKSEPLSDDEPENSAELCSNLAESNAIKTEPDVDSDSTDIPTDSDDNESCQPSAKLKRPLADTRSSDVLYQLPKISETEHLSRAEKMRLLQQRIKEQEMMLENIKKQRHEFVMQRKSNPYLKDLY